MSMLGNRGAGIPTATVREAEKRLIEGNGEAVLIDVREPDEYSEVRAQGAVNIPLSELQAREAEVPRDKDVLLICHSGFRSMQAALFLRRQGYERVTNVQGGTEEWENAGLPVAHGK